MRGMTLIEVVIALSLFSIISLFTVTSTSTGFKIRKKVSTQNDYYHMVRVVLHHMDRDISQAFHAFSDTNLGQSHRLQKVEPTEYIQSSFFRGTRDKLSFSSFSHRRLYRDTKETKTCEIDYFVDTDSENPAINNLFKRESTFIDEDFYEGGAKDIIAENIDSLSFRYLSKKGIGTEGTWVDRWDSTEGEYMNLFPSAVEVTLVFPHPYLPEETLKFVERIKILKPNNLGEKSGS